MLWKNIKQCKYFSSIKNTLLILNFLVVGWAFAYGQELTDYSPSSLNLHQWGAITLFHGLPSNHVRAIAQDGDGILWFGTDSGLAKYDGRRTQKIVTANLPSERISALKLINNTELWVGTDAGAVRLLNTTSNEIQPIPGTDKKFITSITFSKPDKVILTSQQGTIYIYSLTQHNITKIEKLEPSDSPLLSIDSSKTTALTITGAVTTDQGLIVSTRGRGLLAISGQEVKEVFLKPRPYFVDAIAKDKNENIFIGAQTSKEDSGLIDTTNPLRTQKLGAATGSVISICFTPEEDLWVGTSEKGVFHFKDSREVEHFSFENSSGGLQSNQVYTIFVDQEGVVWFGTDRGVCRYDPNSPHAEKISDLADTNYVRIFCQSTNGQLWCGSNRGLFTREPKTIGWQQISELGNRSIHSILENESTGLFIGTSAGLYLSQLSKDGKYKEFTKIEKDPTNTNDAIRAIALFQNKVYLANFGQGLEVIENNQRKVIWPPNNSDASLKDIISLYSDGSQRLWIGTNKAGIWYYDGQQVVSEASLALLKNNTIRAILGSYTDSLWLGTDKGLYQYKNNQLTLAIKDADVWALANSEKGALWCATKEKGLFKITFNNWVGLVFSRLGNEHGLPSDNVFALFSSNSEAEEVLWIGTNRGIAQYKPGKTPPILKITKILGSQVYQPDEIAKGINLTYPQNSLVIDVAATSNRTFPEQFQYLFMLLDNENRIIKQRLAKDSQFLTETLRPGKYKIEVRAYTTALVDSQPINLYFTVASSPFPWTTLSLSVLLTLSLFALWWGYHQNVKLVGTNTALATANQQLAETRLQLASETENERQRIARDLHDQTLSDLRQLLMMTDQLPNEKNGDKRSQATIFRSEIESISTEIRRICEDLSPSVLTNVGLTAALEWSLTEAVKHLPKEQKFDYEFVCDDDLEDRLNFDSTIQIQIYRIIQEAISNICKHAQATHVRLSIDINKEDMFIVTLSDNGCGFREATKTGRGLNNISSRASLIDANVSWQSNSNGTIFSLQKSNSAPKKDTLSSI